MFCIVFWILKCLPDSYDGRKWLAKVQVNNSSQVISQDFLVRLDSAELTWLGSGLKTFVTCLWLDFICFMTWHEFKYPVDLKQRNKSSSVIVTICNVWHHGPESSYYEYYLCCIALVGRHITVLNKFHGWHFQLRPFQFSFFSLLPLPSAKN